MPSIFSRSLRLGQDEQNLKNDTHTPPCLLFTKSLMSMSLAELISYCLIDLQTALIHHRTIQYLTPLISVYPSTLFHCTGHYTWREGSHCAMGIFYTGHKQTLTHQHTHVVKAQSYDRFLLPMYSTIICVSINYASNKHCWGCCGDTDSSNEGWCSGMCLTSVLY